MVRGNVRRMSLRSVANKNLPTQTKPLFGVDVSRKKALLSPIKLTGERVAILYFNISSQHKGTRTKYDLSLVAEFRKLTDFSLKSTKVIG